MPRSTNLSVATMGIDIGKNSFHVVGLDCVGEHAQWTIASQRARYRLEVPVRTKDVWSIRTKIQVEKRNRDLAMFNLAIDSYAAAMSSTLRSKLWPQGYDRRSRHRPAEENRTSRPIATLWNYRDFGKGA